MAKKKLPKIRTKIPHSTASYREVDGSSQCDLVELANEYQFIGNIPERMAILRAHEIALLSRGFLDLWEKYKK